MDMSSLPSSPLKQRNVKQNESTEKSEKRNANQQGKDAKNSEADKGTGPLRTNEYNDDERTENIKSKHPPSDKQSSEETEHSDSQKEVS